jgi:hypothetical protein
VLGDRLRLEQILLNLLSNAVKFTPHGRVDLRVRVLARAGRQLRLRFEVQDTGIGIREEQMPHLFEAFEQADVSTTRRFGGTGLGLAISKRLALLMGGDIGADSREGAGSLFWVELPFQMTVTAPARGPRPRWPPPAPRPHPVPTGAGRASCWPRTTPPTRRWRACCCAAGAWTTPWPTTARRPCAWSRAAASTWC